MVIVSLHLKNGGWGNGYWICECRGAMALELLIKFDILVGTCHCYDAPFNVPQHSCLNLSIFDIEPT